MEFKVISNWDNSILEKSSRIKITFMGKFEDDGKGITRKYAESYIKKCNDTGNEFNYILDGEFNSEVNGLLEWIVKSGIQWVTVAHPTLVNTIKREYPKLKVSISPLAGIETVERAKYFENIGADELILDESVNRNFNTIKAFRSSVSCKLSLYANSSCNIKCQNTLRSFINNCFLECSRSKISNPIEIMKANWIRPEDVKIYEGLGIDSLIILGSRFDSFKVLKSYQNRSYDGNILSLLNLMETDIPYINNDALNGYIDFIGNHDCLSTTCEKCKFCFEVGEKVIMSKEFNF